MKRFINIFRAYSLMKRSHDGQIRKFSGKGYYTHPLAVAKLVFWNSNPNNLIDSIISALLHDVVEDTDITIEYINDNFGYNVAKLVSELTSDSKLVKSMGKSNYLSDKMINMSDDGLRIKLSDRLHNCSDLEIGTEKFRNKYVDETDIILKRLLKERKRLKKDQLYLMSLIDQKISAF